MGYEIPDPSKAAKRVKELFFDSSLLPANDIQVRVRRNPAKITMKFFSCHNADFLVAEFTLEQQPNCCGTLVSTNTFVDPTWRGQGIAQAMMTLKEAIAREFGYSSLTATVNITGNPAEVHILKKFGWTQGWSFKNDRTGNEVGFFFKALNK